MFGVDKWIFVKYKQDWLKKQRENELRFTVYVLYLVHSLGDLKEEEEEIEEE